MEFIDEGNGYRGVVLGTESSSGAKSSGAHEKKNAHARDYARRKRKELQYVNDKALFIYNELVRMGVYNSLSDEAKEFFDVYVHREERAQYPYPPLMYRMFGATIAPGVQCTLKEAMQRLYKGKNEINLHVRRWGEKQGVHIDIIAPDDGDLLDTVYRIARVDTKAPADSVSAEDFMCKREKASFRDYESKK